MNYDELMKTGRITAVRKFFESHGYQPTESYLDWFYDNFLGICKNMGFLHGNNEDLNSSPYAEMALAVYAMGN